MKKQLSDVMCELHVPSFETAKKFYRDLDFNVVWERKSTDKTEGYMVMRRVNSVLSFYSGTTRVYDQEYFKQFPHNTKRGYAVEIVIPVDDIEDFYRAVLQKHTDRIIMPLSERFYYRDFRMEDPFGFYLRFVERYNWVDTRNSDGGSKKEFTIEAEKFKKLMSSGQRQESMEENRTPKKK